MNQQPNDEKKQKENKPPDIVGALVVSTIFFFIGLLWILDALSEFKNKSTVYIVPLAKDVMSSFSFIVLIAGGIMFIIGARILLSALLPRIKQLFPKNMNSNKWLFLLLLLVFCSCASKAEKEAYRLYEAAQASFQKSDYEAT